METRQEIFEQLLPEETFVDRRLMTEALWEMAGAGKRRPEDLSYSKIYNDINA